MKTQVKTFLLVIVAITFFNCNNDDDVVTPTGNTSEFFKYSINGGAERVFDSYATGRYTSNTNSAFHKFTFRAGADTANGASLTVDGDFTFSDLNSFLTETNYIWGISDGITANFYFSEANTNGIVFLPSPNVLPSNPVMVTVTIQPTTIGDYIEFTFSGDFLDATDNSIQGSVQGEGRIRRDNDS